MLSPASIRCLLRSTGHALRRAERLIRPALASAALCLMTACTHESGLPIEKTTLPTDPDRAAWEAWQSAQAASRAGMHAGTGQVTGSPNRRSGPVAPPPPDPSAAPSAPSALPTPSAPPDPSPASVWYQRLMPETVASEIELWMATTGEEPVDLSSLSSLEACDDATCTPLPVTTRGMVISPGHEGSATRLGQVTTTQRMVRYMLARGRTTTGRVFIQRIYLARDVDLHGNRPGVRVFMLVSGNGRCEDASCLEITAAVADDGTPDARTPDVHAAATGTGAP